MKTTYVIDGVEVRRQPPVIVWACVPPSSGKVQAPCGYEALSCKGESQLCGECGFTYCEQHLGAHRKRYELPPDGWRTITRALVRWRDRVVKRPGLPFRAPPGLMDEKA